jgi:hypothetical protein
MDFTADRQRWVVPYVGRNNDTVFPLDHAVGKIAQVLDQGVANLTSNVIWVVDHTLDRVNDTINLVLTGVYMIVIVIIISCFACICLKNHWRSNTVHPSGDV